MKKVVKVSIGGIAFTLEEAAHAELEIYLNSLEAYYKQKEGGDEIVEGIEERLSELLSERGYGERVVTLDVINEILSILGRPEEIESEMEMESEKEAPKVKRKLYRDLQNKLLGGVCAGIASYFSLDPTAIRIIAFILGLVSAFSSDGAGLALYILLYFALWVIIPSAKTVEQRCQMKGERASVDSIERRVTDGVNEIARSDFGKGLYKFIRIFAGILLLMMGIGGLCINAMLAFGLSLFDVMTPFSTWDVLSIFSGISPAMSVVVNILFILVVILPFVGMLYAGVILSFNFKAPRWRPGLINFIVWILACISLVAVVVNGSSDYWECESKTEVEKIDIVSDTIRIEYAEVEKFEDMYIYLDADRNSYRLGYVDKVDNGACIVSYPELRVRDAQDGDYRIRSEYDYFPNTLDFEEWQGITNGKLYHFDGSVLTLYPVIYSRESKVKVIDMDVTIYLPEGIRKVIESPVYHEFNTSTEYSDIKFVKKFIL